MVRLRFLHQRILLKAGLFLLPTCLLNACMVGPDYEKSAPPRVKSYTNKSLPSKTASSKAAGNAGKSQRFIKGRDVAGEWWKLFHSPEINELINIAMQNSPDLDSAKQALVQAREAYNAQYGNLIYPALDATVGGERQKFAGANFGNEVGSSLFNLYNATVNVAYTVDVFGGNRRQLESLQAQADNQQFQLLATYLTMTSNIVTTAVTIASYEAQIKASKDLLKSQQDQLNILRKQLRLGGVAMPDVLAQKSLVEQTKATIPPLEKSLSQAKHALTTLIGGYPETKLPHISLDKLKLPTDLPVSIPSKLVQQRPDVRASEALVHSASAEIGVATAALFPTFNITGTFGYVSDVPSGLFRAINEAWTVGGSIAQPLFRGGALFSYRRQIIAQYRQALAQYKQTLLQAFQNTADSLRALETDARTLRDTKSAEIAARDTLRITKKQYRAGGVSFIDLLNAQVQYQQARIASVQATAMRFADTAALYQSLGGGWWNSKYFKCNKELNPTEASLTCP